MKSRKQLLAEIRKKAAAAEKAKNRDLFVRKLLKRHGILPSHDDPDTECFRGYDAYISNVFPIGQCMVGVVKGCTYCRGSETGFAQIKLGQTRNLSFKCRMEHIPESKPRLWIMQPGECPKTPFPCVARIPRQKPRVDAHGHVIDGVPRHGPPTMEPFAPVHMDDGTLPEPGMQQMPPGNATINMTPQFDTPDQIVQWIPASPSIEEISLTLGRLSLAHRQFIETQFSEEPHSVRIQTDQHGRYRFVIRQNNTTMVFG